MFDSAFELIIQAASNTLFVFCFCNLIIAMILVGSKPCASFDRAQGRSMVSLSTVSSSHTNVKPAKKAELCLNKTGSSTAVDHQAPCANEGNDEEDCNNVSSTESSGDENEENNDELKRRAEEFIAKVNRELRAEISRTV